MKVSLPDAVGKRVELTNISETEFPVFFAPKVRLAAAQPRTQPTLLFEQSVWDFVRRTAHAGAFGSDFQTVGPLAGASKPAWRNMSWVAVWKFPHDLNTIRIGSRPLIRRIVGVPLPVGEYPLTDDGWVAGVRQQRDEEGWTKLRVDTESGDACHFLQSRRGERHAMISSMKYVKSFASATRLERQNIVDLVSALAQHRLASFPCHGQHHAIVFLLAPDKFARRLAKPSSEVFQALQRHTTEDLSSWRKAYVRLFGR
jgi:hypothetical protein